MKSIMPLFIAMLLLISVPTFAAEKLNINTASAQQISSTMKGVGKQKAKLIVDYRQQHGPFNNLNQLNMVKGIGKKTIDDNRELIIVK